MISKAMTVLALVAATAAANAPADRYFGRLKMSALRIRYETMQLRKRYETRQLYPDQARHLLDLTDDAFEAWAAAYPHDTWLASTAFLLARAYGELPGGVARARAVALFTFITTHFPKTRYAAQSRVVLHRGLPVRRVPSWAIRTPAPVTPAPTASSTPSPAATLSPLPTVTPSPRATS